MGDGRTSIPLREEVNGLYKGSAVEVQAVVGADRLLVKERDAGTPHLISIDEFTVERTEGTDTPKETIYEAEELWSEAERRYSVIEPLVARAEDAVGRPPIFSPREHQKWRPVGRPPIFSPREHQKWRLVM